MNNHIAYPPLSLATLISACRYSVTIRSESYSIKRKIAESVSNIKFVFKPFKLFSMLFWITNFQFLKVLQLPINGRK